MRLRQRLRLPVLLTAASLTALSNPDACQADCPPPSSVTPSSERLPDRSAPGKVRLPGLVIDLENRCLDLAGVICLDRGPLELIACTKGTKEHESIVALPARAIHVHTALLLLGANNGLPASQKPVNAEKTRWIHVPPSGDPIEVFLVTQAKNGKPVERPIREFIVRSKERVDEVDGAVHVAPGGIERRHAGDRQVNRLPQTFIFSGSHLKDNGPGPRLYLADISGNVISIATFGDEVLCLPFHETQQDGALMWCVKPQTLPGVGTKVILRLRPKRTQTRSSDADPTDDGTNSSQSPSADSASGPADRRPETPGSADCLSG